MSIFIIIVSLILYAKFTTKHFDEPGVQRAMWLSESFSRPNSRPKKR